MSASVKPSASRRSRVTAIFFLLPMQPMYFAGVRSIWDSTS